LKIQGGYAGVSWNTGSTDTSIVVTKPGKYFVTVTGGCGGQYSDTIEIITAPAVAVSLGPDRIKCNNDTLHIAAPSGFINYSWSPNYKISSISSQSVIVNPLVDTSYIIKAEKTPGCFAFDTVHIKVNRSPVINLGADTSFCTGDSLKLNAGLGFSFYLWNNGSTGRQIVVKNAGVYSVTGTTADGCKSYDTFKVHSVYPLPVVTLIDNPDLCTGTIRILDAGSFASYKWHDGSTDKNFKAKGIGRYHVEVVNSNGCRASDTTSITNLLPIPKNFLPPDTTICSFGNLTIKALQNYPRFSWSTNHNSSSVNVTKPGVYWLEVTDAKSCVGRDSVKVDLKQCMQGLFVPTAFTPNNDGKNDKLKALLFGDIKLFDFKIFDKHGHIVFETKDPTQGWEGKIKGVQQNSGTYVWMCKYQLAGEAEKVEKGTIVLLR
jgi:gliding motility-associated-like protein